MATGIKRLDFANAQLFVNWIKEQDIIQFRISDAIIVSGYNKVTHYIYIKGDSEKYFIIKRFDGANILLHNNELINAIRDMNPYMCSSKGVITNAKVNQDSSGKFIEITKYSCTVKDYIPTLYGIQYHIGHWYKNTEWNAYGNEFKIEETKMRKQDLINLQSKLNMIGAPNIIVDLNTLAALKDRVIHLYTCQSNIKQN
jgi:hypothetical protein